ncbi:MAG: peptidylprolyl isomerase [Hyphomicrobiaceae bacterium]
MAGLVALATMVVFCCGAAFGQSAQLPGLVVTVPPPSPSDAAPAPPPAGPQAQPKKAPPKAAKREPAAAEKASGGADAGAGKGIGTGQNIVVLVNDDPITGFEVDQRARLLALQANVGVRAQENMKRLATAEDTTKRWRGIVEQTVRDNQGKSREQIMAILEQKRAQFGEGLRQQALESAKSSVLPGLRKTALEELVEERIKMQEAKKLSALADDVDVDNIVRNIAKRNNLSEKEFAENLRKGGADVAAMKARFKATLSWNEVVRRRFGRDVVVNPLEIDRFVSQAAKGDDEIELDVQRLILTVPGKLAQKDFASRLVDAEKIRRSFKDCKSLPGLVAGVENAKLENLGIRKPSSIPEPARTLLLNARDGEMLPPSPGAGVIDLYVLCSRKVVKADDKARNEAAAELRQKEFELLARRHLKNLRQDAHIEYR